jgi:hypothetical protein
MFKYWSLRPFWLSFSTKYFVYFNFAFFVHKCDRNMVMEAIEFKRMDDFRTKGTGKFYNEPQFYTVFFSWCFVFIVWRSIWICDLSHNRNKFKLENINLRSVV